MSFREAVDDYQHGRLTAARERLVTLDDVDAKLLFVRIQTRLGDTSDAAIAIELARELFASAVVTVPDRIQAGILLSFLLARTGAVKDAEHCIKETKRLVDHTTMTADLESELWLGDAVVLFAQDRHLECEQAAWNAIYADLELGHSASAKRFAVVPIQSTKARAFHILGLIRGSQERYHEQYRFLREAMILLRSAPSRDVYLVSVLQANRSFYARDFGMLNEIVELEVVLPHELWPKDVAKYRLEVARSLGYLYALKGYDQGAIDCFRDAFAGTTSAANRLLLLSDEAYISRQRESPHILVATLAEGCKIADGVAWESIDVERYALHAFAQELSFVNPSRATAYMEYYFRLESKTNPLRVYDKRAAAEAQYSMGLVAIAAGRRDLALDAFVKAYEIWREVGFRWRATAAAIELAGLSGSTGFGSYAERESQQYPNSWLARRVSRLGSRASPVPFSR